MQVYGTMLVIMGMQYGSEGKGALTEYFAIIATMGARAGASNAGHTIYFRGKRYIMRQIPAAWINPNATLVIGIGSVISPDVVMEEITMIERLLPVKHRLKIDYRAHVITQRQINEESKSDLETRISSTSARSREGIGQASADKVLRKAHCVQAKDYKPFKPYLADTVELINEEIDRQGIVLAEGTQGFGLSVDHGHFPFCTSRDITVSAIASSLGVSTHHCPVQVIGVLRTYPIRVAGNSGPFEVDSKELNWIEVAKRANAPVDITERTSVTHKVRRVATFSDTQLKRAVMVNRPTEIALTFADYLNWNAHEKEVISPETESFIEHVEEVADVPVSLIKTGPRTVIDCDPYRRSIFRRIG